MTITLDEDTVRNDDTYSAPDGDTAYADSLNLLRTAVQHHAATILAPYEPELGNPTIEYNGITYTT